MIAPPVSSAPMTGQQDAPADAPPAFSEPEWQRIALQQPWVDQAANRHALPPNLINAIIWVESRFQPRAKSPAGARGLMQLMPATAAELARKMGKHRAAPYDPEFNVAAGSLYLKKLVDKYDGDVRLALAAYHAGSGNVDKWIAGDGLPPMSEEYVALVLDAKRRFDAWHRPTTTPPETMIAKMETSPAPEPEPAPPPEPYDVVPDPPVRYDLDKVESTYVPTIRARAAAARHPVAADRRRAEGPRAQARGRARGGAANGHRRRPPLGARLEPRLSRGANPPARRRS